MPTHLSIITTVTALVWALLTPSATQADEREAHKEKHAVFYTTYGYLDGDRWHIPMRIWVSEESDALRRLAARGIRSELARRAGLAELDEHQAQLFMSRAEGFIADSESREVVLFEFDDDPERKRFALRDEEGETGTDRNGLIEGRITLETDRAQMLLDAQKSDDGWLSYRAVSRRHSGAGRVRLLEPTGVSVISDVDDTIKITEIPAGEQAVLNNTFFRDFVAAPCMAEMYRAFGDDVAFHYVSGGPWQFYEPLTRFLFSTAVGFPEGGFLMKNVRTNPFESESYEDIWKLVAQGAKQATFEQKVGQVRTLMTHFPERSFILIGDTGERDPEVFRTIKEHFGEQVREIRIRDVVNDREHNPGRLRDMTIIPAGADPAACPIKADT